jgi:Tol biopolymer transport system component
MSRFTRRAWWAAAAALLAVATLAGPALAGRPAADGLPAIRQLSQNTQPGWGKVYASSSAGGWYVALISNGDLAPGAPGNPDHSWEVFRWANDGQVIQVTHSTGERPPPIASGTSAPSISADGRRIAFASMQDLVPGAPGNADRSWEVFLWEEGRPLRQLTDSPGGDGRLGSLQPWISADGRRLAFASDRHGPVPGAGIYADTQTDVYLWTEGEGVRRLTQVASPQRRAWMPRIAPDGRHVAFYSNADLTPGTPGNTDGTAEVFAWDDGMGFRQLTSQAGGRALGLWSAPALSWDGSVVAFDADGDLTPGAPGNADGSTEVYVWSAADGLRQVTDLPAGKSARSPTVTGDGAQVAFVSTADLTPGAPGNPDGGQELFLRSADGALRQLTRGAAAGGIALPVLSAGGETMAFLSDRDLAVGNQVLTPQTFVMNLSAPQPPGQATPTPPAAAGRACPQIARQVPEPVQQAALANPNSAYGWLMPRNPALQPGPGNPLRTWLALLAPSKPFGPGNPVVWKVGCP